MNVKKTIITTFSILLSLLFALYGLATFFAMMRLDTSDEVFWEPNIVYVGVAYFLVLLVSQFLGIRFLWREKSRWLICFLLFVTPFLLGGFITFFQ
jgi:hypothetical protein